MKTFFRAVGALTVLTLMMSTVSLTQALSPPDVFPDVPGTHPNSESIDYVREQGIVSGYPDGTFGPWNSVNRAEFTKIVISAQFTEAQINGCVKSLFSFKDVPADAWFASYVCVAKQNGIIGGYPDGTFRPGSNISLVEAAKILVSAFGYQVGSDDAVWFRPFIEKLAELQAIPKDIAAFDTQIARAHLAEMVYRVKAGVTDRGSHSYASLGGEVESPTPTPPAPTPEPEKTPPAPQQPEPETITPPQAQEEPLRLTGSFTSAAHPTSGTAIYSTGTLTLTNFSTDPGPDLKVWLSTDKSASSSINLGELKSVSGSQSYAVPAGTDLDTYSEVLIWCEAFGVLFGAASLN